MSNSCICGELESINKFGYHPDCYFHGKFKVKITQIVTVEMTQDEFDSLKESCDGGDRQHLHEVIEWREDELLIEKVE